MSKIDLKSFGPLAVLAGTWQGSMGNDTAPGDDRDVEKNAFREEIVFTPMSPTANHEQLLFVMSYTRTAWRLKEEDPFHQQLLESFRIHFWIANSRRFNIRRLLPLTDRNLSCMKRTRRFRSKGRAPLFITSTKTGWKRPSSGVHSVGAVIARACN